jgi:tRNA(His) 5'-end guanylyltransferase
MNDELGNRMKEQYENRTRYFLPRRTYTLLRLDGKSFHTYTRGLKKPFDDGLSEDIDNAIIAMLPHLQGAVFAYTQSDEISVLLTDFATPQTDAWFDGNIQKMSSVAASIMTAEFNKSVTTREIKQLCLDNLNSNDISFDIKHTQLAYFDCRAFTIPDRTEVMNYFRWRQQDCVRNSVSMVAQANFSHKELHGKSQSMMHEMLHQKGVNWATDFTDGEKNGRVIVKETYLQSMVSVDIESIPVQIEPIHPVQRTRWVSKGAWVFTKDEGKLLQMIPNYEL